MLKRGKEQVKRSGEGVTFFTGCESRHREKVMFKQKVRESARICWGRAFQTREVASRCEGLKMGTSLVY